MFTFIIMANSVDISSNVNLAFSSLGSPKEEDGGRLIIEGINGMQDGWIAFQPIVDAQYDYDKDELYEIKKIVKNPSFYLIGGRDGIENFSNEFIKNFDCQGEVLIDNDHGMISDLMTIKNYIELGKDWLHLKL